MKKVSLVLCAALLVGLFAGCAGGADSAVVDGTGSTADYRTVIENARSADLNESGFFSIVTGPEDEMHDMFFEPSFGFVEEDMERYALSIGTIIVQAYGIAIVLPVEGKRQAVVDQMNGYVEQQRKNQENYLPDQYEIAKAALVKTVPTGEVVMVMVENADQVMTNIEQALAAG